MTLASFSYLVITRVAIPPDSWQLANWLVCYDTYVFKGADGVTVDDTAC